jgi:hypothetical protein
MSSLKDEGNVAHNAPFHVLMSSRQPQQELLKHPSLQKDYLARRYLALHGDKPQQDIWSAVLSAERAMMECCEVNQKRADETLEEIVVDGALMRSKELSFVALLARSCHSPALRALALAILERTMEQDDWETTDYERQREIGKEPVREPSRMGKFVSAGGLTILKQWLIDAMTPVQQDTTVKSVASANDAKKRKVRQLTASPTGPLLLPLLAILKNIPFDKALVTETKINKQIRNLKKGLDDAMLEKKKGNQKFRDPIAGGLVVSQVQAAVEALMDQWKISIKTSTFVAKDPFESLKETMRERLALLQSYEAGKSEKPDFLTSFEQSERLAKEQKEISKLSTRELEERERKLDRERLLQVMQKEKQEVQTKIKAKIDEVKQREQSKKRKSDDPQKRAVRWKDGYEHADHLRQRSKLEEVFYFTKDELIEEQDQATAMADALRSSDDVDMDGISMVGGEDEMWG